MLGEEAGLRQRPGALCSILSGRVIIGFVSRFLPQSAMLFLCYFRRYHLRLHLSERYLSTDFLILIARIFP